MLKIKKIIQKLFFQGAGLFYLHYVRVWKKEKVF